MILIFNGICLRFSDRKPKRDGKPKKAKVDHLEHIPYRLREIMKSKEAMKTGAPKAKKAKEGENDSINCWVSFCMLYTSCR